MYNFMNPKVNQIIQSHIHLLVLGPPSPESNMTPIADYKLTVESTFQNDIDESKAFDPGAPEITIEELYEDLEFEYNENQDLGYPDINEGNPLVKSDWDWYTNVLVYYLAQKEGLPVATPTPSPPPTPFNVFKEAQEQAALVSYGSNDRLVVLPTFYADTEAEYRTATGNGALDQSDQNWYRDTLLFYIADRDGIRVASPNLSETNPPVVTPDSNFDFDIFKENLEDAVKVVFADYGDDALGYFYAVLELEYSNWVAKQFDPPDSIYFNDTAGNQIYELQFVTLEPGVTPYAPPSTDPLFVGLDPTNWEEYTNTLLYWLISIEGITDHNVPYNPMDIVTIQTQEENLGNESVDTPDYTYDSSDIYDAMDEPLNDYPKYITQDVLNSIESGNDVNNFANPDATLANSGGKVTVTDIGDVAENYINTGKNLYFDLILPLAVLIIVIGGFKKIFHFSNPEANTEGNKIITNALGIVLVGTIIMTSTLLLSLDSGTHTLSNLLNAVPFTGADLIYNQTNTTFADYLTRIFNTFTDFMDAVGDFLSRTVIAVGLIGIGLSFMRVQFSLGNQAAMSNAREDLKRVTLALLAFLSLEMILDIIRNALL